MKPRHLTTSALLISVLNLTGCASFMNSKMPTQSHWTMTNVYQHAINGNDFTHTPVTDVVSNRRLPNPDIPLYIFPHYAGDKQNIPIPGYTTTFPLYTTIEYGAN